MSSARRPPTVIARKTQRTDARYGIAELILVRTVRSSTAGLRSYPAPCQRARPAQPSIRGHTRISKPARAPEAEFFASEEQAKDDSAKRGYHFETIGGRGAATYFESYAVTDRSLPPCQPDATLNEFGPPVCNPEPPWLTYTVVSYGALKPRGPEALVSVGLAGGAHVQKPIVIKLNQGILAGRIR